MKRKSNKTNRRIRATLTADLERVRGGLWNHGSVMGDLGLQIDAHEGAAPSLGSPDHTFDTVDFDDRSDYVGTGEPGRF